MGAGVCLHYAGGVGGGVCDRGVCAMIPHGESVWVRGVCDDTYESAVIAGSWLREHDILDCGGRFILSPRGYVYQVRYKPEGGVYNVHESRVCAS